MGVKYLWDTNTVIYYLQKQFPEVVRIYMHRLLKSGLPTISVVTEIELLCWKTDNTDRKKVLNTFLSKVSIIELEQPIKFKTVALRKTIRIKLPDAIIAATAIVHDLTLVTRHVKDFTNIHGLNDH
ncbi:type II toxin-antitoxin system VapC family toxin [Cardinium endosymbiont of Sogatella furcifera]|uniref:type II toxin-antitoxin system VapC family toxin n=1 Tax=Cardinium endosymbiont of Sogatella furcifera TaxID=650378 RepID=UPI000E0D37C9|nr:type II toxin-antitoxin system VapC family toxin [Candidatus Cardinium sp.]